MWRSESIDISVEVASSVKYLVTYWCVHDMDGSIAFEGW